MVPEYVAAFIFEIAFYVLLLVFTLHALFLGYHWFSYGSERRISLIALAVYLLGGAILFITLALSFRLM